MNLDERIAALQEKVAQKKKALKSTEKPNWQTNCMFKWPSNETTNLHTADENQIATIYAYLLRRQESFKQALAELELKLEANHNGYPIVAWLEDLKTRLNIVQLSKNKKDLAALEAKLEELMSPEAKRAKALSEIEELLK